MQIKNHFLFDDNGNQVKYIKSPNTDSRTMDYRYLCLHYTAGPSAIGAATHFSDPNAKASAHLVVDRNGTLIQCVPFSAPAYHAGTSEYKDIKGSINRCSIGIEIVNFGPLTKTEDGKFWSWTGKEIPASEVVMAQHQLLGGNVKPWQTYTDKQIEVVETLCRLLVNEYKLTEIVTHEEVCVPKGRKLDVGPNFPINNLRAKIFGRHD